MVDFTALADVLNKDIMPSVKVQVYERAPMWQIFGGFKADANAFAESQVYDGTTPQVEFKNNLIYVTIQTGRPANTSIGVGNSFIYGTVPTAQGYLGISTPVGAFLIPKQVMKMKSDGAIVNTVQWNMEASVNSLAMDLNRQCYGDGSATLAYASPSGTGQTINLVPKATASTLYNNDIPLAVRYFPIGTVISVGGDARTKVTAITGDNQITVADSQTWSNYDAIVKYDGSDEIASEMTGLGAIVDDSSIYMAINPSAEATWKAYKNTNSGSAKTFVKGDFNHAYNRANVTGKVKFLAMNMTEFEKYGESLTDLVRFQKSDILAGGWNGLDFMSGQAKILMDSDCPDDRVYFLSPEELMRAELQPLEFEAGTLQGGQRLAGTLNFEMVCDTMCNIATAKRSAHSVLTNRVG